MNRPGPAILARRKPKRARAEPEAGDPLEATGDDGDLEGEGARPAEPGPASRGAEGQGAFESSLRQCAIGLAGCGKRKQSANGAGPKQKNAGRTEARERRARTGRELAWSGIARGRGSGNPSSARRAISACARSFNGNGSIIRRCSRKLVREFREGDKALALRRAIPIMRPGDGRAPMIPVRGELAALATGRCIAWANCSSVRVEARRFRSAWPGTR